MNHRILTVVLASMLLFACGHKQQRPDTCVDSASVEDILQTVAPSANGTEAPSANTTGVDTAAAESVGASPSGLEVAPADAPSHRAGRTSRYYKEGFRKGYCDGEEDAFTHSGWQSTYDDACQYRGWKRSAFEDGYEAGYESGFDDNS